MEMIMDRTDLRQRELNILIAFANFCDEHELNYYLFGGSLLGAIRHKGFIPWDDDIDVAMPREDYERFYQLTKEDGIHSSRYRVIFYRDDSSCYPFIKIEDTTTLVRPKYRDEKYYYGLWIDVFPLDTLPSEQKARHRMFKKALVLRFFAHTASADTSSAESGFRLIIKKLLVPILRCIGIQRLNRIFDSYCAKYQGESTGQLGNICWAVGTRESMPTAFLEKTTVEFEGHTFQTTKHWDYYLSKIYGNYMELPPESQRKVHIIEYEIKENS